jgi:hypothetical protein
MEQGRYGKIKFCMPNVLKDTNYDPPRMIPSLVEGFNAIASNIYLIIFPIALDLLFWLGPRLRVKQYFLPLVLEAAELSATAYGEQAAGFVETSRDIWTAILNQFNLFFSLKTFPVGIPSLLVSYITEQNPMGVPISFEASSGSMIATSVAILMLVGVILGSIYFAMIANAAVGRRPLDATAIVNQSAQTLVLSLILLFTSVLLALPISCLLSSLALIMPSLGTFPFVVLGLMMVWVLLPLAFSPHGIFAGDLKATRSIVTSFRLVRSMTTATGMFFIMLIIIGYGLDILWTTPAADSWLLLVGIFGHAFISSGLLAASFKFYDQGIKWQQQVLQAHQKEQSSAARSSD